ncbi:interaptin isoform X2 [Sander lucioperca]|nr:interaptin isoform X2 [Sander lucioperca]
MALLEELSGCKLLYRFRSSPHRIFRLNNISKALAFLDDRHVKLLGIDASAIADGIPSVVLNLVWNMILHFQVKEMTGGLQKHLSSSLSSLSMSSYPSSSNLSPQPNDIGSYSCNTMPSKGRKAARKPKYHGKAIKTLLQWVQRCTSNFGVEVHDFGKSWRSGLAFLAMIKSINPALVDLKESLSREPRANIQLAFLIAHHSLDIPPLLEPEDVSGTSPDEQSIITYVSMFLRHCSGTDEDHTTNIEDPEIANFGSLESVSFEETLAEDPEAQALLQGLQKSSEQLLWKSWARSSSGSPRATSLHTSEATSPFIKKQSRRRSILQRPSPLDAGVVGQEIRSWMEKASVDQGYSKPRADESFSLSSEEGIYSLLALDSDEEDAYSYILDLNKEVFQPYNQLISSMVEEETVEEMFLNGQKIEYSKHLEVCEMLNGTGCKHQEGSLAQNVESEIRAKSLIHSLFDWDKGESSSREMANSMAVFSMKPGKDSSDNREESEGERVVRGQSNDDSDCCEEEQRKEKTENARLMKHGCDKREALVDETKNTKLFEVAIWKTAFEEESVRGLFEKGRQVSEKRVVDKEEVEVNEKVLTDEAVYKVRDAGASSINTKEENDGKDNARKMEDEDKVEYSDAVTNSVDFEEIRTVEEKDRKRTIKKHKLTDRVATRIDHPGKTAPKNDTNGAINVRGGESWIPQSLREEGFILQSSAASCDITPLELEMLLVLWILLYSCFILPQMNF